MGGAGTSYTPKIAEGKYGDWVNEYNRWDCSGFVGYCVGAPWGTRLFSTLNQGDILRSKGFKLMGLNNDSLLPYYLELKPGDVLVYNDPNNRTGGAHGHTQIAYDSKHCFGARGPQGTPVGISGDLRLYTAFSHGWTEWWRPPGGIAIEKWVPA